MFQKTIKKIISFSGIGLHSGKKTNVLLQPSPINTGIIFQFKKIKIPLSIENVTDTVRSINISKKEINIITIEHLIASLYMLGITNLIINIDNNEIPSMDGSAAPFIKLIKKAGIHTQNKPLHLIFLKKPVKFIQKNKFIIALPSHELKITYHINFPHPVLRNQSIFFDKINEKTFIKHIAPARTFGFLNEVESLLKKGLALGGNLNNAVVLTETGLVNKKLRFKNECIRHKILDFIAALSFLHSPICAHFLIYKSGHKLDIQFVKKLMGSF